MKSGRDSYLQFFRYFHTVRHMKISQIFSRITFDYRRKFLSIVDTKMVSELATGLKPNINLEEKTDLEFCFFNKSYKLPLSGFPWTKNTFNEEVEKAWVDYLNSFIWLNYSPQTMINKGLASSLILDWIAQNKSELSDSWMPQPLSKRITAWVKHLRENNVTNEIASIIKLSISLQLKRLFVDMEYHNPGNHLMENLRGFITGCSYLISAKQYFNNEVESQLEQIVKESTREISRQFLADGAHFERSPMYHKKMLEVVKDIKKEAEYLVKQPFLAPSLIEELAKLLKISVSKLPLIEKWLELMTFPDGMISQFGDSEKTQGIKPKSYDINMLLEPSGYFVRHCGDNSLILNCGEPAPIFQPRHSHCDILSYELAIKGHRVIIDSGSNSYENETLRQIARESESHNIPMVQHHEQSDIWGSFSMGKRAKVTERSYNYEENKLLIKIEDQFGQKFERELFFYPQKIEIKDSLIKRRIEGNLVSLVHLAPNIVPQITENKNNERTIDCQMTNVTKFSIITKGKVRIEDYLYFPEMGKTIGGKVLILSNKESEALNYVIRW